MDEYSLIVSAQKGEKEAFQSLIKLYYPYILKFLMKLCKDEILSEDLTQDTFIKLIRGIDHFDIHGRASFSTYATAAARNCYIDYLRRNKQIYLSIEEFEIESGLDLQSNVIDALQFEDILKSLENLPSEQSEAIRLKFIEQLTLQEIADKFKCEPKTIKSRIHNGLTKLRRAIKGD